MKDINEATAPSKTVGKVLEKDIQSACVNWARWRGYWARKFSSQSQRSVPDYLFSKHGLFPPCEFKRVKFATEFKAPGRTSTAAQIDEQEAMRLGGWFVFECDNFDKFKATVLAYEAEQV
jgi:hypothetical protein